MVSYGEDGMRKLFTILLITAFTMVSCSNKSNVGSNELLELQEKYNKLQNDYDALLNEYATYKADILIKDITTVSQTDYAEIVNELNYYKSIINIKESNTINAEYVTIYEDEIITMQYCYVSTALLSGCNYSCQGGIVVRVENKTDTTVRLQTPNLSLDRETLQGFAFILSAVPPKSFSTFCVCMESVPTNTNPEIISGKFYVLDEDGSYNNKAFESYDAKFVDIKLR